MNMKRIIPIILLSLVIVLSVVAFVIPKEQVKCTVSGDLINKSKAVTLNHNGSDYYFCSDKCSEKFKANPAEYQAVTECGDRVNKDTALQSAYNGKTYYFCNSGCKEDFDKDPETHIKKHSTGAEHDCPAKKAATCPAAKSAGCSKAQAGTCGDQKASSGSKTE